MTLFVWKDIYSVGNSTIDNQHKKLFEIANRFSNAYEQNQGRQVLGGIFQELLEYTRFHFEDEERLMREANYPDYPQHKANHEKLVNVVLNLKKNFEQGEAGIEQRIMDFIKMWLNGHILGMDRNYRAHVSDASAVDQQVLAGSANPQLARPRPKRP